MKKILFTQFFVAFLCVGLFSQFSVDLSEEFKKPVDAKFSNFLHVDDGGYYLYFKEGTGFMKLNKSIRLIKFNKQKELEYNKIYKADKAMSSVNIDLMHLNDKFSLLSFKKNSKTNAYDFYVKHILPDGKELDNKLIGSAKYRNRVVKKKFIPSIKLSTSNQKKKILFTVNPDEQKKDENLEFFLKAFDSDFNTEWEKTIKLPYSQKHGYVGAWEIADDGKVFFIVHVRKSNKKKKSARDLFIYTYDPVKDELKKCDLDMGDRIIKKVKLKIDKSNNLLCSGLYGVSRLGPSQGVFFVKIAGEDGSLISKSKRDFSEEEIAVFGKWVTSKDLTNKKKGLKNKFVLDNIMVMNNGDIYFTAEFRDKERMNTSGSDTSKEFIKRNAIVVTKVNPEGEIENVRLLHKFQEKDHDEKAILSYSLFKTDDELYYIYNEHGTNVKKEIMNPKKMYVLGDIGRGTPVFVKLDDQSTMTRSRIFEGIKLKKGLHAAKVKQINDNQFLVFLDIPGAMIGKSKYKFGIVTIDDLDGVFKK